MKLQRRLAIAIALVLLVGLLFYSPIPLSGISASHRLGFWLQESDITNCTWQQGYQECGAAHPAQHFFNSMFLTPPYPSTIEVMIFAISQAKTNSQPCSSVSSYISSSESFWGDLAQLANAYPNIRLVYEIAFDSSNGGTGTYGLSCFNSMVQYFGQYPSVYGLGIEGEYTTSLTAAQMQTALTDVNAVGKTFINYYIHGVQIPAGGYQIYHTNFPEAGDQVGTLGGGGPNTVGIDSGYYYSFPFPQNLITCPIGPNVIVTGSVEGWNQCVVSTELSVAVGLPASQRQFVELDVGFSSSGSFVGVSGQSTDHVWDNPTLRNWVWTDSNYASNFILSTSSAPPPTTTFSQTSTMASSTLTTTSATTITTTSGGSTITTTSSTTITTPTGGPPPAPNITAITIVVLIAAAAGFLFLRRKKR